MIEPASIVVISLRFLGDVLLTTPLIRSLREAHPGAAIDALVFSGTEGMLEGNPDVRKTILVERQAPHGALIALWLRLWRNYDIAVIAETGDRPHIFGWVAARRRVGLLPPQWNKRWWKRLSVERGVIQPSDRGRPKGYEMLARTIGIAWRPGIVAPTAGVTEGAWRDILGFDAECQRYAVLHPAPRFRYKRWHKAGWHSLIAWLYGNGMRVVITGGPGKEERNYVSELLAGAETKVIDVCGRLRIAQTADLLRRAALFVGPDTAATHLAAACGTPTVALFGPTDPQLWGPMPITGIERAYEKVVAIQQRGNVSLLQEPTLPCVPCQKEGCERHLESRSDCLDDMSATRVIEAAQNALRQNGAAAQP